MNPTPTPTEDWTADSNGFSNSSEDFLAAVEQTKWRLRGTALDPEWVKNAAHGIVANLAHGPLRMAPLSRQAYDAGEWHRKYDEARGQLADVDTVLARRSALQDFPSRTQKVLYAISRAADADRMEKQRNDALNSEHDLRDRYVALRTKLGALDVPKGWPNPSTAHFTYTEQKLDELIAERDRLQGILGTNPSIEGALMTMQAQRNEAQRKLESVNQARGSELREIQQLIKERDDWKRQSDAIADKVFDNTGKSLQRAAAISAIAKALGVQRPEGEEGYGWLLDALKNRLGEAPLLRKDYAELNSRYMSQGWRHDEFSTRQMREKTKLMEALRSVGVEVTHTGGEMSITFPKPPENTMAMAMDLETTLGIVETSPAPPLGSSQQSLLRRGWPHLVGGVSQNALDQAIEADRVSRELYQLRHHYSRLQRRFEAQRTRYFEALEENHTLRKVARADLQSVGDDLSKPPPAGSEDPFRG